MKKYSNGLTLIELIVVLIILSITGLMTLQYGGASLQHFQLEKTARQLRYFIFYYQNKALWLNENYLLRLNPTQGKQRLEVVQLQYLFDVAVFHVLGVFDINNSNIIISISSGGRAKELYLSGKRGTNIAGHILLSNASGRLKLIISNIGRIRLENVEDSL